VDREKRQVKKRLSCPSTSAAGEGKKKNFPRMHKTSDEQALLLCNVVSTRTGTPPSDTHTKREWIRTCRTNDKMREPWRKGVEREKGGMSGFRADNEAG